MGFRNPVTTAASVDTSNGRAGAPSARMYGQEVTPGSGVYQGVVEWFDGVGTARATLTGGGVGDSGGNVFELAGAPVQGSAAARLQLNVEGLGGSGYGPVARLIGAGLVIDSPGTRIQGLKPLLGNAGAVNATTNASGQVTVSHGLTFAPTSVLITPGAAGAIPNLVDFVVAAVGATTFTVTAIRRDTNAVFTGNPVSFEWAALQPAP
jgi:hypothetical protein